MSEMLFDSADKDKTLYQSLLDQVHLHGRKHVIAEEASRQKMNYGQLLTRSSVLGNALSRQTQEGGNCRHSTTECAQYGGHFFCLTGLWTGAGNVEFFDGCT